MANSISGRVIAVSQIQRVPSTDPSKQPLVKREIFIDCTRYDPYTGERSQYENKPLLEFSGEKTLERVNQKLEAIKAGDVVRVSFDIQGTPYQDRATGKTKVYTAIRCYDVEMVRTAGQPVAAPQTVQQQVQANPAVQQLADNLGLQPVDKNDGLPF